VKDAFFCIPLHPDSQPLFAFEDPTNLSQQLTWTVLPQGFRDSPHLFGQALTKDLLDWQHPGVTLLQYVDDLPLCGSTEPLVSRATEPLLNFLASRGYKVSREKAQLNLPRVTYLGMIPEGQTCSLSLGQIKSILGYPLPQLQAFLGVTGLCHIWILGYADLARPYISFLKGLNKTLSPILNGTQRAKRLSKLPIGTPIGSSPELEPAICI
jgi:hypothetical protein